MRILARSLSGIRAPIGLALLLVAAGCDDGGDLHGQADPGRAASTPVATVAAASSPTTDRAPAAEPPATLADPELAPAHLELLGIAWDAGSAMPIDPFIKDRSRAQARVVEACLELDQAEYARRSVAGIENWRRGIGFADLAAHLVERVRTSGASADDPVAIETLERARGYLVTALEIAETTEDWRRDRIRVQAARAYALLGEVDVARGLEAGVVEAETGRVDAIVALSEDPAAFESAIASFERAIATGSFDLTRNALLGATRLHEADYADVARRERLETLVTESWEQVPFAVRVELLERLAETALANGDPANALALVDRAGEIVAAQRWSAENEVPIRGRLAGLRHRAGDPEGARAEVDAVLALFDERLRTIANLFRAEALIPVCESLVAMGDVDAARALYGRALDESLDNPNSRPRAADLVAIACSMATVDFDVDDATLARMRGIRDELSAPW